MKRRYQIRDQDFGLAIYEADFAAEALAALPASAFTLTKAQFREPSLQRMRAGATIDAAVQEVWASDATLAAIRELGRPVRYGT